MNILGIDPGTTSIGYAIVQSAHEARLAESGLISIATTTTQDRLLELHRNLTQIIHRHKPHCMAIERLFFAKNTKTALSVAEARGVTLLTATLAEISIYEYTPLEIKKVITGDGRADKTQVQKMVMLTLPNTAPKKARDDVYDAIAAALTHHFLKKTIV